MTTAPAGWQVDRRFYWSLALMFAIGVAFTLLPGGLDFSTVEDVDPNSDFGEVGSGSLARKLQWLPLFMFAGVVFLYRAQLALNMARHINIFLVLFVLWCFVTTLWSPYPGTTFRKCVQLFGVLMIALSFQLASWTPRRYQDVLRPTIHWIVLLSVPFAILFPELGIHSGGDTDGKWSGLTTNKNTLGLAAAFSTILWLHGWASAEVRTRSAVFGVLLALVVQLLAQSGTAFAVTAVGGAIVIMVLRPPVDYRGRLLSWLLSLALLIGIPYYIWSMAFGAPTMTDVLTPVAALFGKDVTLTGRSDIWLMVLEFAADHPVQGVGYGAFWLGPDSMIAPIVDKLYWVPRQAHNGYIDVLNETGLIGLTLVVGYLVVYAIQLARVAGVDRSAFALHSAVFAYLIMTNIAETVMFRTITLCFFVTTVSSLCLSRILFEAELRQQAQRLQFGQARPA